MAVCFSVPTRISLVPFPLYTHENLVAACEAEEQNKLKKLESQMMAMWRNHETQVGDLKQRIALLEERTQFTPTKHHWVFGTLEAPRSVREARASSHGTCGEGKAGRWAHSWQEAALDSQPHGRYHRWAV